MKTPFQLQNFSVFYFFGDVETKKPGKLSAFDGRARYRNRSDVVELVGKEPLKFARVDNGVTTVLPKKKR